MNDTDKGIPADWAIERACKLFGWNTSSASERSRLVRSNSYVAPFARYIAEHEQEPVDPVLVEARNLADAFWPGEDALAGKLDNTERTARLMTALRRGMELAKVTPE